MAERQLLYFADPMCSWCWGFSPVVEELGTRYQVRATLAVVMGNYKTPGLG